MSFLWDGFQQGWHLIWSRDPDLVHLIRITLQVVGISTAVSVALGLPAGLLLGLGRFRGRGVLVALANAGLGLPPVVVGLYLALLMFPGSLLGRYSLLYTLKGVYIAQSCLCLPIMVALTVSAVRELPTGLLAQARAFGAGRLAVARLATREARVGIVAAVIAAVGSGVLEVGAITVVGGNIHGYDQTLASGALEAVGAGRYAFGVAIGIVLLALVVVISGLLTVLQYGRLQRGWRAS